MQTLALLVEERAGFRRDAEPVTVGLPFPKGYLSSPARLELRGRDGQPLPLQAETLARWSDGSVKWALLDFQASVEPLSTTTYELLAGGGSPAADARGIAVEESADQIVVDTGAAVFVLDPHRFRPFRRAVVGGRDVLGADASETRLIDEQGRAYVAEITHIEVETRGTCRTTVLARGEFRDAARQACASFTGRLGFFRNSGTVEIRFTLRNSQAATHHGGFWDLGDPGSIYLRDLSIAMAFASPGGARIEWLEDSAGPSRGEAQATLEIYQDSSGGENWKSSNHVNRHGAVMHAFRGYRVMADGSPRSTGHRASPIVTVRDAQKSLSVVVEGFWQNFPKAVKVDAGVVNIGLFPAQYRDVHELQGGEQKSHRVVLHFGTGGDEPGALRWAHDRLVPRATPAWYAETGAVPYLSPVASPATPSRALADADALVGSAVAGPESFFVRREIIDEYGWRHFGDLYADHEAVGHQGPEARVAHYNNQYDAIHGAAAQYLRSGDQRWFDLTGDLARHVIDIDVYHTDRDRPAFNGGMFWHTEHYTGAATCSHRSYSRTNVGDRNSQACGGGPSSEHNYTAGLNVYHYLTGDPLAKDVVQGLAEWVIAMDDGRRRRGGWLDRRSTGFASQTVSREYHGPGRGCGNSINTLMDGYSATGERRFLVKAEALIRRSVHPRDEIAGFSLDDVEHRWSYTVFLQTLGKYLDLKSEVGEIDQMFSYTRESLLHYARWMVRHEVPYKVVLDRVEIPTETWPAQDIRKANVLAFATKYAERDEAAVFRERADFFFRTCVSDLLSFETAALTRPIVILMTNAYMQGSGAWREGGLGPSYGPPRDFGRPRRFVPQFAELHRLSTGLAGVVRRLLAR